MSAQTAEIVADTRLVIQSIIYRGLDLTQPHSLEDGVIADFNDAIQRAENDGDEVSIRGICKVWAQAFTLEAF